MSSVHRSAKADADLAAIWRYIAEDSENAADKIARMIIDRVRQLALNPYLGPRREDIAPGVRHLTSGSYLILYRVHADQIEILRILHGSRNMDETAIG